MIIAIQLYLYDIAVIINIHLFKIDNTFTFIRILIAYLINYAYIRLQGVCTVSHLFWNFNNSCVIRDLLVKNN